MKRHFRNKCSLEFVEKEVKLSKETKKQQGSHGSAQNWVANGVVQLRASCHSARLRSHLFGAFNFSTAVSVHFASASADFNPDSRCSRSCRFFFLLPDLSDSKAFFFSSLHLLLFFHFLSVISLLALLQVSRPDFHIHKRHIRQICAFHEAEKRHSLAYFLVYLGFCSKKLRTSDKVVNLPLGPLSHLVF
jgi:hypothetical protein